MGGVLPLDHCALLMYQRIAHVHVPAYHYFWKGYACVYRRSLLRAISYCFTEPHCLHYPDLRDGSMYQLGLPEVV